MDRIDELIELLNKYAEAYYNIEVAPLVSDAEYDALFDELTELERRTGAVRLNSPTIMVGAAVAQNKFSPHTHLNRLYSLDKVQSLDELKSFMIKLKRTVNNAVFALEYKFDGLTVNLTYRNGHLDEAATRGNGVVGEAILNQVKTIKSIPQTIEYKGTLEVQGEGVMRLSVLEKYNKTAQKPLKNARNAVAGALRNLDPRVTASRSLDCFCYSVGYAQDKTFSDYRDMRAFLIENGFPVSDFAFFSDDENEIIDEIKEINRGSLDFLIDGMVLKLCNMDHWENLGYTDRFPKFEMAYKFPAETAETTVLDIDWQVGRTGKLTPLARVVPVELCGATVKNATLNNFDDIVRKRVSKGARVLIRRSNDVIPEILSSLSMEATIEAPPNFCPSCKAHVEKRGVHIFCTNSLSCASQIEARISHFAARDCMDIDGLSDKTAELLHTELGVDSIPKLYELTEIELLSLQKFGEKKAASIIGAIEKSKNCSLAAFLFAIGIPNVGKKTAMDVANKFLTLKAVRAASREELMSVPDIGDVVADDIIAFFGDRKISEDIDRLLILGVLPRSVEKPIEGGAFFGKTVVITGTLPTLSRRSAEEIIVKNGGKTASSVSKKTDFLIAGEEAGSKLERARELNIRIVDEKEFLAMLNGNAPGESD
ncbi:MAG: NAD-dependent DNA ligase LigA [Clostridia bacterium]